jgi:peptidoglycan-associated lipoprotein
MKRHFVKEFATAVTQGALMVLGACKKKVAPAPPPPPPPPPAPTASMSVSPSSIQAGGSASLTWQTTNATDVSIDGIGAVQANGSQTVSPTESTTYHLTAKGPGGTQEATTRLTMTQPPEPPPAAPSISGIYSTRTSKTFTSISTNPTFAQTSVLPFLFVVDSGEG